MEITHTLPKYQTRNPQWHPKFNSYNCNMSFVKMQRTQSLTRPTTHAVISTSHNSISSKYLQPFTSLATSRANPIFHAANKNFILKHISTIAILFLHPPFISHNLARGLTTLRERKQLNVNTHTLHPSSSLTTNFPSLLTNQLLQQKLCLHP